MKGAVAQAINLPYEGVQWPGLLTCCMKGVVAPGY